MSALLCQNDLNNKGGGTVQWVAPTPWKRPSGYYVSQVPDGLTEPHPRAVHADTPVVKVRTHQEGQRHHTSPTSTLSLRSSRMWRWR